MEENNQFNKISREWLKVKRLSVKYSTYIKYKNIIQLYLDDFYSGKDINEYDDEDYYEFFNNLMNNRHLSNSLINSLRFVLKAILTYGEKKYNLQLVHFPDIKLPNNKLDVKVLSREETQLLSSYCQSNVNSETLAIYLSMYTGMRLGEICGLKWEDIDFDKGLIYVSRTVQRIENENNEESKTCKMVFEPKTQSSKRIIVMADFLNEYLRAYKFFIRYQSDHYIISNSLEIPEPRNIQRKFKRICKKLDIDLNFHSLRHSFATNCISYGVDMKALSEILGHSSISTTMNLYVHPSLEYKREQMNKIPK